MIDSYLSLRNIFDVLKDPIFIKNQHGEFIYCNYSFANYFNLEPSAVIGHKIHDLISHDFADECVKKDQKILETGDKGICYYLAKDNPTKKINVYRFAIRDQNGSFVGIFGRIIVEDSENVAGKKSDVKLTTRESQILALMADGNSIKMIARQLNISHHTVIHHIKKIYIKLNVNSRLNAINIARQLGLLTI